MRQDFSRQLVQFNGEPMAFRSDANGIPIRRRSVTSPWRLCSRSAFRTASHCRCRQDASPGLSAAQRIYEAKEPINITAEEVVFIKERVEQHFLQPLVVGQVLLMLEGGGGN